LWWLEPVVAVPRFAANRASAVRGAREAVDGSFRRPTVGEHPRPDFCLDNFEYVVEVMPPDIFAAEDRENVLDVPVLSSELGPLGCLGWRSDQVDHFGRTIGSRTLDSCVDFAVEANRGTDGDEVLL